MNDRDLVNRRSNDASFKMSEPMSSARELREAKGKQRLPIEAPIETNVSSTSESPRGAPRLVELPTDWARSVVPSHRRGTARVLLTRDLVEDLKKLVIQHEVSLRAGMCAGWCIVLSKLSGQEDIVVGIAPPDASAAPEETYDDPFCVRVSIDRELSAIDVLRRVHNDLSDAGVHRSIRSEKMGRVPQTESSSSLRPVAQFLLVFGDASESSRKSSGLASRESKTPPHHASRDLIMEVRESEAGIIVVLDYSSDLFEQNTIERWLASFERVLGEVARNSHLRVGALAIMGDEERRRVVDEFNATAANDQEGALVHLLFEAQARRTPELAAAIFESNSISYAALNAKSNQLARHLRDKGVHPGALVGVCVERGLEMVVALLAVLKAGGAYVPLDPLHPDERLAFMLHDCAPAAVVTQLHFHERLSLPDGAEVVVLDEGPWENLEWASARSDNLCPEQIGLTPAHLAYVIYTSGSTGAPKGVMVQHANVIYFVRALENSIHGLEPSCRRIAWNSSFGFDMAVKAWSQLTQGRTVYLLPEAVRLGGDQLLDFLNVHHIDAIECTPSHLRMMQEAGLLEGRAGSLRKVLLGGEAIDRTTWRALATFEKTTFFNMYGPTECTVDATSGKIKGDTPNLGRVLRGARVYILDTYQQLVPIGTAGEIYIGGAGVSRGYLHRPDLTAARFVADPFCIDAGARMYRTGDLGRWRSDGTVEYMGRNDDQVKVRGFRIELGEIEARLGQDELVKNAAVIAREDAPGDKRLVAYIAVDTSKLKALHRGERTESPSDDLVAQWKTVHDSTYQLEGADAHAPSFVGWNSSYTGQPIPVGEMQEWVRDTIERITSLNPQRVLEVGCGAGLLLQHLGARCGDYWASDFSGVAIQRLAHWLATRPDLSHVKLLQKRADELAGLPVGLFDTVIMNSVVQYFPDTNYLTDVLGAAVALVEPRGRVFIGDVRHLGLLHAFHTSILLERAPGQMSVAELRERISRAVEQDRELAIDPSLFLRLPEWLRNVTEVEIQLKQGHSDNELTRYRYDVVLHIGEATEITAERRLPLNTGESAEQLIQRLLQGEQRDGVVIQGIGNRRVAADTVAWGLISRDEGEISVQELRSVLAQDRVDDCLDPAEVYSLAAEHGYVASLTFSGDRAPVAFDARLTKGGARRFRRVSRSLSHEDDAPMAREAFTKICAEKYTNDPLLRSLKQQLPLRLREGLATRVPDYMIPSAFVVLDSLPLTRNGKVDRQALPAPEFRAYASRGYEPPVGEVEEVLAGAWQALLQLDRVGRQDNFFELGGHSLLIVQLMERLRRVGLSTELRHVFESPTLADLAGKLRGVGPELVQVPPNLIPPDCQAITPEMLTLVNLDAGNIEQIVSRVPGGASNVQDIYPLAPLQEGLLFHHLLNAGRGDTYVIPTLISVASRRRLDELIASLQMIVDRHDVLRTAVMWEQLPRPVQVVCRHVTVPVKMIALDSNRDPEEQVGEWIKPERQQMDLRRAPLLKVQAARDPRGEAWYVLLQMHHIATDYVSSKMVTAEVVAHLEGRAERLPESIPYRNHVAQALAYAPSHDAEAFFRSKLADIDEPTAPFDLLDVHGDGSRIEEARKEFELRFCRRIRVQARRLSVSAATLFHAAWALVVAHTSGRDDIVFGSVLLGRLQGAAGAQRILGMFINTLPLRLRLHHVTSRALVERTQRELVDLLSHEQSSLAVARRCSGVVGSTPLFSALLNYAHSVPSSDTRWSSARGIKTLARRDRTNYPITVTVDDLGEGFALLAQTDRRVNPERVANYLHEAMQSLIAALEHAPQTPALALGILPESERRQLIASFNVTQASYPRDKLIHQLFEEQVERTPHAVAVSHADRHLTYRQLNRRANQLAHLLRKVGVRPETFVGLCVERGLDMVVGVIGILKAGGAYVPLDPNYPRQRLEHMLADTKPTAVVTQEHLNDALPVTGAHAILLDKDALEIAKQPAMNPPMDPVSTDHVAYVIYTSGSTGRPKGVQIEHRNAVNLIYWARAAMPWEVFDQTLHSTSLNFDLSVYECFVPLATGGTIRVVKNALEVVNEPAGITHINTVPSAISAILDTGRLPETTRVVNLAGEPLKKELVDRIFERSSVERICNLYGPSETTTYSTWIQMPRESGFDASIGRPIANTQIYILGVHRQVAPIGVAGEIYIGGAGVARGYLNRPELTAERFVSDPFSSNPRAQLYKTGDLGRWRVDGTIEYLGRNDHQVKIRGFRIELEEIEAHLARIDGVKVAVVILREDTPGQKRLVAYLVPRDQGVPSMEAMRARLKSVLPEYMLPNAFVMLECVPLTPNGKLDRRALPAPELDSYLIREYEAPKNEVEEILAGIWRELLKIDRVGRRDNFFELGGHSLLIIQMKERLRRVGLAAELRSVFDSPTLADLADSIWSEAAEKYVVPANLIPAGCREITPAMLPLVELDGENIELIAKTVPGGAENVQDIYPLAPLQEGILFHHLLDAERGDTYVLRVALSLSSKSRLDDLIMALQAVIDRHDVLRTAVLWEGLPRPVQVVYRNASLPVEEIGLDACRSGEEQIQEWLRSDRQQLDLRQAPPVRMKVARDARADLWYAMLQFHHIAIDHETLEVMTSEVVAHLEGRTGDLPESMPYRHHVAQALEYANARNAEAFFRGKLGDIDTPTAPFGLLDVHGDGSRIDEAREVVEGDLARRVRVQARRLGVSAATLFHAAWAIVVARTSGRDDVVFGTLLLGRMHGEAGAQRTLGMFINTLPLRLRLRGMGARDLVEMTQREVVELLNHEQASLALAQQCSGVTGSSPLFTTLFNYRHSVPDPQNEWATARGVRVVASKERTNYPITLSVDDLGEGFTVTAHTDKRIDPSRISRYMHAAVRSLIEALEEEPTREALGLSVLPPTEMREIVELFNRTRVADRKDEPIHKLFEDQARRTPMAVALVHGKGRLTYGELNKKANQLARYLRNRGIGADQLVAVCVERGFTMITAILGALKAGAAYVPLDPSMPGERLRYMIRDAAPAAVLTQQKLTSRLATSGVEIIALEPTWSEIESHDSADLSGAEVGLQPTNRLYVIYTSGSTGQPKGTEMSHGSMVNLIEWHRERLPLAEQTRVLQFAAFGFDVAFQEIFSTLCGGGTLVLLDEWVRRDPQALLELLGTQLVERLFLPPLALQSLAEHFVSTNAVSPSLRDIISAGEQLRIGPEILTFIKSLKGCRLHNHYGPTETHVVTALSLVDAPDAWPASPTIGRPIANTEIYILDPRMRPAPIGVPGEMYIGGTGVARGYLNRPELTAQRFLPNPFIGERDARLYRTGDLGQWRDDGTLEYLGRNDEQVKIRGYRIELGDIEAQLLLDEQVREAAVIAREDVPGEKRLVAYVVGVGGHSPSIETLRARLRLTLPDYMLPSAFVTLDTLPLTTSGKLNRRALPPPAFENYADQRYEAPEGEVEVALAKIWRDVLPVSRVSRDDNFFDAGGHSLLVLRALSRINRSLSCSLRVIDVYRNPTIRQLASRIGRGEMEQGLIDLPKESVLDDDIVAKPGRVSLPARAIMLTGATGFVGRFLLSQLLRETHATIYCLARARSEADALSRVRATLLKWDLWHEQFETRIVGIPADLRMPRLGLHSATYQRLADKIDAIYHCGSSMNHLETYDMAKPANVDSVRELSRFATLGKLKLLNHISTLGVFSSSTIPGRRVVNEDTPIEHEKHLTSSGYVGSKWVAEKILMLASERGIPCNILRVGLVWADAHQGRYDELQRRYRLIKSCLLSGHGIMNHRELMCPTPVDYVARAVVSLASRHCDGLGVFHISATDQMSEGLFERCNAVAGTELKLLPYYDWICHIRRLHEKGISLPVVPLIEHFFSMREAEFHEYQRRLHSEAVRFDCARTNLEIEGAGIVAPMLNDSLLRLTLKSMLSRDADLRELNDEEDAGSGMSASH